MGESFESGPWTLGSKYKWVNLIAIVWVAICVVIFSLPFTPAGVPWRTRLQLDVRQLRAVDLVGVMLRRHDLVLRLGQQDLQGPGPDDRGADATSRTPSRRSAAPAVA